MKQKALLTEKDLERVCRYAERLFKKFLENQRSFSAGDYTSLLLMIKLIQTLNNGSDCLIYRCGVKAYRISELSIIEEREPIDRIRDSILKNLNEGN